MPKEDPLKQSLEFERAVLRLSEALARPKDEFLRDSVIQRFEFCVELAWKTARKTLGLTATAPRIIIRDLAQQGLIANPQLWFEFLEARNLSSHTYREDLAEQVYACARRAEPEFKALLDRLKAL